MNHKEKSIVRAYNEGALVPASTEKRGSAAVDSIFDIFRGGATGVHHDRVDDDHPDIADGGDFDIQRVDGAYYNGGLHTVERPDNEYYVYPADLFLRSTMVVMNGGDKTEKYDTQIMLFDAGGLLPDTGGSVRVNLGVSDGVLGYHFVLTRNDLEAGPAEIKIDVAGKTWRFSMTEDHAEIFLPACRVGERRIHTGSFLAPGVPGAISELSYVTASSAADMLWISPNDDSIDVAGRNVQVHFKPMALDSRLGPILIGAILDDDVTELFSALGDAYEVKGGYDESGSL